MTNPNTIDEQLSAFADGELTPAEAELLLARLAREPALRDRWERYHTIGEALRGGLPARYPRELTARVAAALEPEAALRQGGVRTGRFTMPLIGVAVAASVAVMGVMVVRMQLDSPTAPVAPLSASAERATTGGGVLVDYTPQMQAKLGAYVVRHGELAGRSLPAVAPHVRVAAKDVEEVPAATPATTAADATPTAGTTPP